MLATRQGDLLPGLAARADGREATADGLRLRFAATSGNLQAIVAVIDAERQCCGFLRFDLSVEAHGGPLWLALSGPAGTAEFLTELLGA